MKRVITILPDRLAICRLEAGSAWPAWAVEAAGFVAMVRTADELSLVCDRRCIPRGIIAAGEWRAFKVEGPLDFTLVGVLAELAHILAQAGIPIFAVSTYDTDYLLIKTDRVGVARKALNHAGWQVFSSQD